METVQIGGKQHISAKAAARAHGYTMDYIGQLIRGGKLSGSKVGRAWYVDVDSLAAYTGEQKITTPAHIHVSDPSPEPAPASAAESTEAEVTVEEAPQEVRVSSEPESAPVTPPAHTPAFPSRPTITQARELNEVFGMRYIPDEEPMLPLIPEKTLVEAKIEHSVAVRAIHAPMYTPAPAQVARETEPQKTAPVSLAAKNAAHARFVPQLQAKRASLQLPLQKIGLLAACAALVLVILSGAFLERTISVQGEQQTAGVSFSTN